MMTFGPIGFLNPLILTVLATLPVIWWLLRLTPPRPQRVWFPPTRLLEGLTSKEQTPAYSPWWLTALRMLLAALIIFALARPILHPEYKSLPGEGSVVILVDNGWAAANDWNTRKAAMDTLIDQAERNSRLVLLATTTQSGKAGRPEPQAPNEARERAASIQPLPFAPDRRQALDLLGKSLGNHPNSTIVWLGDGLDYGYTDDFVEGLQKLKGPEGHLVLYRGDDLSRLYGLHAVLDKSGKFKARVIRAGGKAESNTVEAWSGRGARLGEAKFSFAGGKTEAEVMFDLPLELRNQIARLEITGVRSAGAVHLLDSRSKRRRVGLISGEARELSQPLLSPLYYIERALSPYSEVLSITDRNVAVAVESLLGRNPSALVLADIGTVGGQTFERLEKWVKKGGVLIRFAGPRLEKAGDQLLPVTLRQGGRTLGGALSWSTPQPLAAFEQKSIFYGLTLSKEVTVNRQVLADPARTSTEIQVWARLADGTPLVTADRRSQGWVVLFHVTANSDWSNLPLSGLFVEMFRRLIDLSAQTALPATSQDSKEGKDLPQISNAQLLTPYQTLDGFGRLSTPPTSAEPINTSEIDHIKPNAKHPPGFYGPSGATRALNLIGPKSVLKAYDALPGATTLASYKTPSPIILKPWLLLAALGIFLIDAMIVIFMSTGVHIGRATARASTLALFTILSFVLLFVPAQAKPENKAKENFALSASLKTRFAYVLTGDAETDQISEQGLKGLSKVITSRTAIEPAAPMAVDVNSDELAFFPFLYWPVRPNAKALSDATLAKIDAYMKQGGMILFDTKDYQQSVTLGGGGEGPGAIALQRLLGKLDIPRLEPVPEGHVLTKSFYLLGSFPGRWDGGALWVEAQAKDDRQSERRARHSDGVSSLLVTSNDFAAAWALDANNRPIYPAVPGGEVQRELSFRSGINIVMYALTGNYKADQVHVPALLERLGQ